MELSRRKNNETPQCSNTSGASNLSNTFGVIDMSSIATQITTINVPFHGQSVATIFHDGQPFVAMRPIVENIGIDWSGQMAKLKNQRDKFGCRDISTPSKGGVQRMLCLPLRKLNGWLFSINPEKVRADIRDKLIQYQEECFSVLHEYWTKGEVKPKTSKTTTDQRTPLRDAVNLLVSKKHLMYPEAYAMIHQRFDVGSIEDLTSEQIPMAVEYVHRVILDGEFLGKQEALPAPKTSYPMSWFDSYRWIVGEKALSAPWTYPANLLTPDADYPNPCGRLLGEMKAAGYEVDAALFHLLSLQHHVQMLRNKVRAVERAVGCN